MNLKRQGPLLQIQKEKITSPTHRCRKIRLVEGDAKCRHLKKFTCQGTLRQEFICLRPRTPYPPATPRLTHCKHEYIILVFTGKGGGRVEPERRLDDQ
jgi:hypothetical protein